MERTSPTDRRAVWWVAALLAAGLSSWGVATSHTLLSHTVDEPTHIAAGVEWLERRTQRLHPENPPLGRIGAGLAAHLDGRTLPAVGTAPQRGVEILYAGGDYLGNLRLARRATLPFLGIVLLVVWAWTNRLRGARAAAFAVAATASLPPLLGHAGLATTDVPFAATLLLTAWALVAWLGGPTTRRSILLGLALGLCVATKFSALVLVPACVLILVPLLRFRRPDRDPVPAGRWGRQVALTGLLALAVGWAAYGFSIGSLDEVPAAARVVDAAFPDAESLPRRLLDGISAWSLPAPDALLGLVFLEAHASRGHSAYLLGEESDHGFWAFYPVALAVKTPLSFLALGALATAGLGQRPRRPVRDAIAPAAAAVAVVLVAMASTVTIGLRHVLVVYPLAAVSIGAGLDALLRKTSSTGAGRGRRLVVVATVAALFAWQLSLVPRVRPDYLAYFNPLAGEEPGRVLVDSDLDWGQDALQLEAALRDLDVPLLHIAYFGSVRLCELDLPPLRHLPPGQPVRGWVAVSEMYFRDHWHLVYPDVCDRTRAHRAPEGLSYDWLRAHEPVATAGRSIRIYHLDD